MQASACENNEHTLEERSREYVVTTWKQVHAKKRERQ